MLPYLKDQYIKILRAKNSHSIILESILKSTPTPTSPITIGDFKELIQGLESGKFKEGVVINLSGFFTNFGQSYFPLTYMPSIPEPAILKDEEKPFLYPITDDISIPQIRGRMELKFQCYQLPVESIPPLTINDTTWKIAFIHPKTFKGFNFGEDASIDKTKIGSCCLKIPDDAMPLILIYDTKNFESYSESEVVVNAQVHLIKKEIMDDFGCCLGDLQYQLNKNCFVRINGATFGLCLVLNKFVGNISSSTKRNVNGNLLLEGCFSKSSITKDALGKAIPNAPPINVRATSYPPYNKDYSAFIPLNPVNFVIREPNTFAIITNSILSETELMKATIGLRQHLFVWIRNIYALNQDKIQNSELQHDLFFLSNAREQTLYGQDNFLKSMEEARI